MRSFVSALACLACSFTLAAQSTPKIEIFGGFSYLNYEAANDNLPSGTETIDTSCPSSSSTTSTCTSTSSVTSPSSFNFNPRMGLYGWNGSVTAIVTPWFGFTTDISGNYSTSSRSATTTQTIIQNFTCSSNASGYCTPSTNTTTNTYQAAVSEPLLHHFLFGPQFYFPTGKMRTYAHFLIGGEHKSISSTEIITPDNSVGIISELVNPNLPGTNNFAMGFGGGVDYPLRKKLSWRTGVDYLTSTGTAQNHIRVTTGLVWRIGK